MNHYWQEISGFDINDCIKQPITAFFEASDKVTIATHIEALKQTESGRATIEVKLRQKNKQWRWTVVEENFFQELKQKMADSAKLVSQMEREKSSWLPTQVRPVAVRCCSNGRPWHMSKYPLNARPLV